MLSSLLTFNELNNTPPQFIRPRWYHYILLPLHTPPTIQSFNDIFWIKFQSKLLSASFHQMMFRCVNASMNINTNTALEWPGTLWRTGCSTGNWNSLEHFIQPYIILVRLTHKSLHPSTYISGYAGILEFVSKHCIY